MRRTLLAQGSTPWHALRNLAIAMHAGREEADQWTKGLDDPTKAVEGEITVRVVHVKDSLGIAGNAPGPWIAQATWEVAA